MLLNLFRQEDGQSMAEYAVTLGVVTAVVISAIALLSGNVNDAIRAVAALL